jgi:hypothetical protein
MKIPSGHHDPAGVHLPIGVVPADQLDLIKRLTILVELRDGDNGGMFLCEPEADAVREAIAALQSRVVPAVTDDQIRKEAKRYSAQFKRGRPYQRTVDDAAQDFEAGFRAALSQAQRQVTDEQGAGILWSKRVESEERFQTLLDDACAANLTVCFENNGTISTTNGFYAEIDEGNVLAALELCLERALSQGAQDHG